MPRPKALTLAVSTAISFALVSTVPASAADNSATVGIADQSTGVWYLRSTNGETTSFFFGNPGDVPFVGDWDCDGVDTPGLYRQSDGYVYLRNSNTQGPADISFFFGNPGDRPLAGDFNADGCDTVSIYRPSEARVFIINTLGSNDGGLGAADLDFYFGDVGDKPFTADFNDNGQDTIGLHRESTGFVYYRNALTTGTAHNEFFFGDPADQIVTGRWAQNPMPGPDTVGIFRPSDGMFYLRFSNSQGNADLDFQYGNSDMAAVAGDFGPLSGGDMPPPTNPVPGLVEKGGGSGDDVVNLSLPMVPVVIEFAHDGSSNFAVWSLDGAFSKVDLLVNDIGMYAGTRPMQLDRDEPVAGLEIIADGKWTYEIRTLSSEPLRTCPVAGSGDSVVVISSFASTGGPATLSHTGSSNFAVWTWFGDDRDLIVNEIGVYGGTVLVTAGHTWWDITADGTWSINC